MFTATQFNLFYYYHAGNIFFNSMLKPYFCQIHSTTKMYDLIDVWKMVKTYTWGYENSYMRNSKNFSK